MAIKKIKMKKILLIGQTGQLGAELIREGASFDFEIISFEKNNLNVNDRLQVEKKIIEIKPDILINTSAYHVLSQCEQNPDKAMLTNFIAVRNLAELCRDNNVVFVTYSTDYVFDGQKGSAYEESDLSNPLQVYGFSKLAGEYAALNIFPEGTFVIRTNGVYGGKNGSPEKNGNFVLNIIKEANDKELIEVSSEQIVSPTYAGDLSRASLKLLNSQALPGIYHLVNEGSCSWYEFTEEIYKLNGIKKLLKPIDRDGLSGGIKRPRFSALQNTKAKALGIILPNWQDGLSRYVAFLKNF